MSRMTFYEKPFPGVVPAFAEIRRRASERKYDHPSTFIDEVTRAVRASVANCDDTDDKAFAGHAMKVFNRECRRRFILTATQWVESVGQIRARAMKLMVEAPGQVPKYAESLTSKISIEKEEAMISENSLHWLCKATKLLKEDEDHSAMIEIIGEMEEQRLKDLLDAEIRMDLTQLRLPTVLRLQKFVKSTLEARGIDCP